MAHQDLQPPKPIMKQIEEWMVGSLNPTLDKIADIRAHAVHKGDVYLMGQLTSGLLLEIGRWRAEARRQLTKAKAQQMRISSNTFIAEKMTEVGKKTTEKLATAELNEQLADWQYTVDVLQYTQDSLAQTLTALQTSLRVMKEEEFLPQDVDDF